MPKMKTKGAAKKRFQVTGNGKVKFKQSFSRHMMMNKPKSMKRKARGMSILNESDAKIILDNFLPYERGLKKAKKSPTPAESAAKKAAAKTGAPKAKKAPVAKAAPKKQLPPRKPKKQRRENNRCLALKKALHARTRVTLKS